MNWCFAQEMATQRAAESTSMTGLLCFLVFVLLALVLGVLLVSALRRRGNAELARRTGVRRKIAQIEREFPDEVRAWGGAEALENPHTVRAIIAKLESNS